MTGELTVLRGDGTRARLYGWITKNMTAREETEIQSVCVDVTERFETERARRIDRYMQALTEVYDKIFEYDFAADTVKCLYGKNSEVFKWVQDIPMQLAEATEKWIRKTVVEADQNRVLAFFRHFYRPENRGDGTVPVQIRYDAFSSDGTVRAYTGVFLQIDTQTSFFCCRRAVSDLAAGLLAEETAALRSLQETLPEMVLRMTDGIVAFEVENDTVRPLYVSDNICDFFGYTKNEWISMTRQRQSIRSFVSRSNVRYEEFMALFQNGEAEFEYMDRRTQCARWICIRVLKKTNELDLFDVFSDRHSAYYEAKLYGGACHGIFLQETSEMASSSCRVHSWRCRFLFDRCGAGCAGFQYQPAASHLLCAEGQPCHFSFL
ncbi:MAG: hypothetical protein PUB63_07245 [Clostridia bacterium]|nr:hypothetical protein [Clostridia bacterium]